MCCECLCKSWSEKDVRSSFDQFLSKLNHFPTISQSFPKMAARRATCAWRVSTGSRNFDQKGNVEHDTLILSASCPPHKRLLCSKSTSALRTALAGIGLHNDVEI